MWLQCQRHFWRMKSHRFRIKEEVSMGALAMVNLSIEFISLV